MNDSNQICQTIAEVCIREKRWKKVALIPFSKPELKQFLKINILLIHGLEYWYMALNI